MREMIEKNGNRIVGRLGAAHRNPQSAFAQAAADKPSTLNSQPSTLNRKRAAFTIVELLMVVTILAILASIITMGVNGMFRSARLKRATAMKLVLKSGLETYYAQQGEWPDGIKDHVPDDEDSVSCPTPRRRRPSARW